MLTYLNPLVVSRKYDRFDYLQVLKSLCPRGPVWKFALVEEGVLRPQGIGSTESWGQPVLSTGGITIFPASVPSSEAFGNAVMSSPDADIAPTGIASDGAFGTASVANLPFHILDEFAASVFDDFWSSDFTSDWHIDHEMPEDKYVAIRGSNGDDRLTPTGYEFTGDFTINTSFYRAASEGSNRSVHFLVKKYSDDSTICDFLFNNGRICFNVGNTKTLPSGPVYLPAKITRVSGVITVSAYYDGSWQVGSVWETPAGSISDSSGYYLVVNGADANGLDFIEITSAGLTIH